MRSFSTAISGRISCVGWKWLYLVGNKHVNSIFDHPFPTTMDEGSRKILNEVRFTWFSIVKTVGITGQIFIKIIRFIGFMYNKLLLGP